MEEKEILPGCEDAQIPEKPEPAAEEVLVKPQGRKKWIPAAVLGGIVLLAAGLVWLFFANQFRLTIELEGEAELLLEYGQAYQEPGARAVLSGNWLLHSGISPEEAEVTMETDLQENVLGKYTVTYSAELYGWKASAQRSIRVVDSQCPVITLVETGATILPGTPYEEEGFTASDNYDGDITDKVHRTEELGIIT